MDNAFNRPRASLADLECVAEDPSLSMGARLLWILLRNHDRDGGPGAYVSDGQLGAHLGVTERTVRALRRELTDRGLVLVHFRGRKGSTYRPVAHRNPEGDFRDSLENPEGDFRELEQNPEADVRDSTETRKQTRKQASTSPRPPIEEEHGNTENHVPSPDGTGAPGEEPEQPRTTRRRSPWPAFQKLPQDGAGRAYPEPFERIWTAYPARAGGNPKRRAYEALRARVTQAPGLDLDAVEAGVRRYAAFLEADGKLGTPYVMQAATFFGPEDPPHWAASWDPPSRNGTGARHQDNGLPAAEIERLRQLGATPR